MGGCSANAFGEGERAGVLSHVQVKKGKLGSYEGKGGPCAGFDLKKKERGGKFPQRNKHSLHGVSKE